MAVVIRGMATGHKERMVSTTPEVFYGHGKTRETDAQISLIT